MSLAESITLLIILAVYFLWSNLNLLFELIESKTSYLTPNNNDGQKWILNTNYTSLVQQTIFFTNDILYNLKIDRFPSYRIYYYEHKKYLGKFDGEVVIYKQNHNDVESLIDTVLHEIYHYIQSITNPDFDNYDAYSKQVGEWHNKFEVEAREFASQHLNDCLLYLEAKGLVKRV